MPRVLAATAFDSRELVFAADDLFGTDIRNTLRELRSRIEKSGLYKGPYKHLEKLSNMADSITDDEIFSVLISGLKKPSSDEGS